jgi:hypothetical protein
VQTRYKTVHTRFAQSDRYAKQCRSVTNSACYEQCPTR